jgi:hypothetical protein
MGGYSHSPSHKINIGGGYSLSPLPHTCIKSWIEGSLFATIARAIQGQLSPRVHPDARLQLDCQKTIFIELKQPCIKLTWVSGKYAQ